MGTEIRNLFTGDTIPVELDKPGADASWSPDGRAVLINTLDSLWFLALDAGFNLITQRQLDGLSDLSAMASFNYEQVGNRWDASGELVVLDSGNTWVIYDAARDQWIDTGYQIDPLDETAEQAYFYQWENGVAVFLQIGGVGYTYRTLDPRSGIETVYYRGDNNAIGPVGLRDEWLIESGFVVNLYTPASEVVLHTFRNDSRSFAAGYYGRVQLHPTLGYFISGRDHAIAGGGLPMLYAVGSLDGTLFRETGDCEADDRLCTFWLPTRVDVARLPAGQNIAAQIEAARLGVIDRTNPADSFGVWHFSADWSLDGSRFAIGGTFYEGGLVVYDAATLTEVGTADVYLWENRAEWGADGLPTAVPAEYPMTEDGNPLITSPDGRYGMNLWQNQLLDLASGDVVYRFQQPHAFPPVPSFSSDGRYVGYAGTIFDLTTLQAYHLPVRGVAGMAFSPDGTRLVTGRGSLIEVWDMAALLGLG